MYSKGPFRLRPISESLITLILFAFIVSSMTIGAGAQSGRKPPRKNDPPAPVQGGEPEPAPSQPTEKPGEVKIGVHVVHDSPSLRSTDYLDNIALQAVSERLKQAPTITVGRSKGMNRKQASEYAKNSKTEHVLWIELDYDSMAVMRDSSNRRRSRELYINYSLFARETGKVTTHGRVYERPVQATVGGVGVPLPVPTGREPIEYIIRQAGQDVADRVLSALNINVPSRK